jgi:hypothetical protein
MNSFLPDILLGVVSFYLMQAGAPGNFETVDVEEEASSPNSIHYG